MALTASLSVVSDHLVCWIFLFIVVVCPLSVCLLFFVLNVGVFFLLLLLSRHCTRNISIVFCRWYVITIDSPVPGISV